MITSRVSPAVRLSGLPGMPCSPGGSSGAGKGSCVTWYVQDEVYLQDILLFKVSRLTMYPRLIP